jgi:hypothetical protein
MSIIKSDAESVHHEAGAACERALSVSGLDLETMTKAVNSRCATLLKMLGDVQAEIVGIGKDLIGIRSFIQDQNVPGGFDGWLSRDFQWSRTQAYRFIDVAKEFGECPKLGHYELSAMYLLAAPGTPQGAKDEARQLVAGGESVDHATATLLIGKYKVDGGVKEGEEQAKRATTPAKSRKATSRPPAESARQTNARPNAAPDKRKDAEPEVENEAGEETKAGPLAASEQRQEFTALVSGRRSFFIHSDAGFDPAHVLALLRKGEATVVDDFVYVGDEEVAWLEFKEDQFAYTDFRQSGVDENAPAEAVILRLPHAAESCPDAVAGADATAEGPATPSTLPPDPYFD